MSQWPSGCSAIRWLELVTLVGSWLNRVPAWPICNDIEQDTLRNLFQSTQLCKRVPDSGRPNLRWIRATSRGSWRLSSHLYNTIETVDKHLLQWVKRLTYAVVGILNRQTVYLSNYNWTRKLATRFFVMFYTKHEGIVMLFKVVFISSPVCFSGHGTRDRKKVESITSGVSSSTFLNRIL